MATYIAILRGINVSGQKKVNMYELKDLFSALNFKNVKTYIQSGNVVFNADTTGLSQISAHIEQKIVEKYGFAVPVLIKTYPEMISIIHHNPFLNEPDIDTTKLHVTFLYDEPLPSNVDKTNGFHYEPDRFIISGREVYVFCLKGYGRTKLHNNFFESKLKVAATTRNWQTVNELTKMAATDNP
jgi:uncharacterized protein (DUF1697 family)